MSGDDVEPKIPLRLEDPLLCAVSALPAFSGEPVMAAFALLKEDNDAAEKDLVKLETVETNEDTLSIDSKEVPEFCREKERGRCSSSSLSLSDWILCTSLFRGSFHVVCLVA